MGRKKSHQENCIKTLESRKMLPFWAPLPAQDKTNHGRRDHLEKAYFTCHPEKHQNNSKCKWLTNVTPSLDSSSRASRSKTLPSNGVSSICWISMLSNRRFTRKVQYIEKQNKILTFQSPVWRIVPSEQRRTNPQQSGIEWLTVIGSISNGPATNFFRVLSTFNRDGTKIPWSFKRFLISCYK